MRLSKSASLPALLALAACAGAPPKRPPAQVKTAAPAALATPPQSPCNEAGALLVSAKAALDEGRLLRARRWLPQVSARCPARAGEALALELRAAVALNDVDAIARLESAAASAPDSLALREALANQAPFGGDIPADITPSTKDQDYYRAARAFVDGKLDEAGRGAMSVALAGPGPLLAEAFVLAARVAEAAGDVPRANRMFARAFHAACGSDCEAPVKPPRQDMFSLAATYPGLRIADRSCVQLTPNREREPYRHFETLTPDGRFHIASAASTAEVRSVPDRVLVGRIHQESSNVRPIACFSDKALFYLVHRLDQRDRVLVGSLGGESRVVTGPRLWVEHTQQLPLMTASGGIYMPSNLDLEGAREWYYAGPQVRALKRLNLPGTWFEPALLPSGEVLGFEETSTRHVRSPPWLVVFDGTTGKRLRRLGPVLDGVRPVLSPDSQRLIYHTDIGLEVGVIDLSKVGLESASNKIVPRPKGEISQILTVKVRDIGSLAAVIDSSHVVFYGHEMRFMVADLVKGGSEPAAITAGPLGRTEVGEGRIVVKIGDSLVALRLSDGRVSRDEPGVAFAPPPTSRQPGWDRERPRPPCTLPAVVGHSGAVLYMCNRAVWRDHPQTQAPAELLGKVPDLVAGAHLRSWDEGSGLFFLTERDELLVSQPVEKRIETLRVRFTNAGTGGIAIDSKGYFEFFGEVPAAFRNSAACVGSMPVDACADLYEAPGLVRRFMAQDFSYRGP